MNIPITLKNKKRGKNTAYASMMPLVKNVVVGDLLLDLIQLSNVKISQCHYFKMSQCQKVYLMRENAKAKLSIAIYF